MYKIPINKWPEQDRPREKLLKLGADYLEVNPREIQSYIKNKYGYIAKTCWIAHVKEMSGLNVEISPRRIYVNKRKVPYPENKIEPAGNAFRHFR